MLPKRNLFLAKQLCKGNFRKKKTTPNYSPKIQDARCALVQQGAWKCAKCQACEQFYQPNSTAQSPKLRCTFRQQLNQTAERAAKPSPTQAKLRVGGTAPSPGYPGTLNTRNREVLLSEENKQKGKGAEQCAPASAGSQHLLLDLVHRFPGLVPAGSSPPLIQWGEWVACKKALSPNLEKYLPTPYSNTPAPFPLRLKWWEKPSARKFWTAFIYFVGLPADLCVRVWFN